MRVILFPLTAAAALFASAAGAQTTPEQQAEMNCIYDTLSEDQRLNVAIMLLGSDEKATQAEATIGPVLDASRNSCTAKHGWQNQQSDAGEYYTLSRITYETIYASLPDGVSAETLDQVMATFSAEDAHRFSYEGQEEASTQGDTPEHQAWVARVEEKLAAAGVAQENVIPAVMYFSAIADFAYASQDWEALFAQQVR